jgi:hypothetical protein
MINHEVGPISLDGTTGGTIGEVNGLNSSFKSMQVALKGRITGKITVTGKAKGAHATEPFGPPLILNLANGEFTVFPVGAFESLTFTPDVTGDDFSVTIMQWPVG